MQICKRVVNGMGNAINECEVVIQKVERQLEQVVSDIHHRGCDTCSRKGVNEQGKQTAEEACYYCGTGDTEYSWRGIVV